MTELDALKWVENQPGLKIKVGKDRHVTLTDGVAVYAEECGILAAVIKLQTILKQLKDQSR